MDHTTAHIPVLLNEATDALVHTTSGCYVDGTFGRGGHSRAILQRLGEDARLIAFDKDPEAVVCANAIKDRRFSIRHESFTGIKELPKSSVDGVLLDLGVSSPQIDTPQRGFSFRHDGPLDMRMDTTRGISVAQWLETAKTEHIAEVIHDYGEERFATQVAKAIVAFRQEQGSITSTAQLASIVAGAVKTREPGQDPATRTFQALRILVNAELEELEQGLKAALDVLADGGHLAVISFHSLEDRIVKTLIAHESREEIDRRAPFAPPRRALRLQPLARIKPDEAEIRANPRSRSAVLRVARRLRSPLESQS